MRFLNGFSLILYMTLTACTDGEIPASESLPDSRTVSVPAGVPIQSRDMTSGETWIERLERPDRIPGLRIDDVIDALDLQVGDVVADIGAGSGAFSVPFAKAVGPTGRVLAVEIWPVLLDYITAKAEKAGVDNVDTILCTPDDPKLPQGQVDLAYFHDVFHNVPDRQAYLKRLTSYLKPNGRIAIIEQEYDDPVARKWDVPEDRIRPEQVDEWMMNVGLELVAEFDLFQGDENLASTGMPERWFVVYARATELGGAESE